MLNFSNIYFKEKLDDFGTWVSAKVTLIAEVAISTTEPSARAFAKEELRRTLHHKVYGELRQPFVELAELALRSHDFATVERARKLQSEIFELLALK